ncbi:MULTISPECIES: lipoprotein-releasing ABC transporter permease subunit LolC [Vibrio]|uniref:lipoprotein-releasing ABC transporter permease subunit LolC n=2 Tax=Vibrionaceae TaxID=641 RepID=UPI0001B94FEE|nr:MULTISPECIES: lipoprotein-releasing ABC transporter permease subunit LolC [Vibrio]EEX33681.1 lipoprotein releasing system transmembrane protein LolC [Vibrio coralliilyticus ATCC BAA-450]MDE3895819.1 lipoprotein-releasing ABC transporter permease subunit LolC [Vibrio sp. CC007]QFT35920.1 Lipoprotein-releasing system transmembrane protein LolC [Vibrio sp. THAF64]QGM33820.1 Lipoprotein-releasing system transmembrane protein LolC [Vibrio sp. THAF191d]QGN69322.1 Lipoprotein-releasing system tran
MFHPVSTFIGLRYLRGRSGDRFSRFVSYMSTAGITIGVMSLVTVLSVMNGFEAQLKGRILGVLPQAIVSEADSKTPYTAIPDFAKQLSTAAHPEPIVQSEAVIQSSDNLSAGLLIGIKPSDHDPIESHLIAGRLSSLQAGKYQVFIGHTLARAMDVSLGDKVRLMVTSASQFTPLGRIPSQRIFTVAGIYNTGSDVDGQLMLTHIDDAARLLRFKKDTITGWRLFFDDPFVVGELSKQPLPEGWQWQDWRDQRGELFQAVRMEKNMMGLMLGLIVGVAAFNIISALIMVVMEKQSEVAILKTQGMTDRQVLAIFMVQGASSGVIGAIFGGTLGVLLASNINALLESAGIALFAVGGELPIVINPTQISIVVALAIALSLLATLFPSYRASSVKPAEALRYE